jgi:hypothetical protein
LSRFGNNKFCPLLKNYISHFTLLHVVLLFMKITISEIIALAVSVICICWAFYRRNQRMRLVQTGIVVDGEVVRIKRITSRDADTNRDTYTYKPVIKYLTNDNRWITEESVYATYPCPYKAGDKIKVVYDPDNVENFTLNDGVAVSVEIIFFSSGIFALLILALLLYANN